ncbi:MAG TPA: PIG-L family deacetylase [Arachnia sp.]|nr:PIG-L family deacetylase [Arachnia sp.]HMT87217.1 PIG-L family deacetylase [Arachnia sp.]
MNDRRLLLVHAHPDDESSQSSVTMARYLDEGAQVTLVTCTLGEMGEILVPEWQHYSPRELGQHRSQEIVDAMAYIGLTDHVYLGGVGHYHDTGMGRDEHGNAVAPDHTPEGAFWNADLLEAANHLVEIIRSRRPQVVITYDERGNYGHPDHIQAHRVTVYALMLAASPVHRPDLGEPWQASRLLYISHNTALWAQAYAIAKERGLTLWGGADRDEDSFGPEPSRIVAVVPIDGYLDRARNALFSHRSQVSMDGEFWQFYQIVQELDGAGDAYQLAWGVPFPVSDAPATDVFAGL